MNLTKKLLFGFMAALALVGCKDDALIQGGDDPVRDPSKGPGVYFALQIDLPNAAGSRSETVKPDSVNGSASNSGVEIGKDYENSINEAIIVLANANANEFIAAAKVNSGDLRATSPTKSSYVAKSSFSKQELSSYYELIQKEDSLPLKANIFVFCNPTQNLRAVLLGQITSAGDTISKGPAQNTNDWLQAVGKIGTDAGSTNTTTIWANNLFLMSNALIATREIPGTIQQWNSFTSEDNPFHLSQTNTIPGFGSIDNGTQSNRGSIKVERACARFDFRDASTLGDFKYHVLYVDRDSVSPKNPLIDVQLQKMFLVNQSNSFYYLPRTVAPMPNTGGASIVGVTVDSLKAGVCKPELPWNWDGNGGYTTPYGNYVADYNISWKNEVFNLWSEAGIQSPGETGSATSGVSSDFDKYFNFPFFNNDGTIDNTDIVGNRWSMYLCDNVVKHGELNNTENWNNNNVYKDYKIWCYSTENTIPSIQGQINGVSTGVVFKAKYSSPITDYSDVNSEDFIKRNNAMVAQAINNDEAVDAKDPVLYMFSKVVYCGWENVREAALEAANAQFAFIKTGERDTIIDDQHLIVPLGYWELRSINRTNSLYKAVFGDGGVGKITFKYTDEGDKQQYEATWDDPLAIDSLCANQAWIDWDNIGRPDDNVLDDKLHLTDPKQTAARDAYKKVVTEAGFTIYQRSYDANFGHGYYCYYYYWNRHNDNHFNGIMGPMEFAVVRNNVYKLAVSKINNLGHPRISANDPHKPGPGTPDEDESVYMDVITQVLPWVVRINDIEF